MAKDINIGGRLHSIATGNVVAGTDEILDDNLGKKQTQINTETYSLVESVNNALDALNPDQQEALAVAAKANANEAKLGYYVCDTGANTAAKTIAATGYVLGTGGNIRIKMTNANTVDAVTLNINSTGAKALFYNGEQASSTNSWEAGETVEVYYDGTSYYANNVVGGSGSGDGAFDVSAKYPTSGVEGGNTYTLEGALAVLNTNLSASKKKGGMSIKFIQSSDNKYVQFRYMSSSTAVADFTNTDNWSFCGDDVLVESPEFITVWTDARKRIVLAVENDGNIIFGIGVPREIVDYINEKIAELSLDEYENIVTFLGNLIEGDKILAQLLDEKVDKVEGKSLIDKDVADRVHYIENPEFIDVWTDSEDRIVIALKNDGDVMFGIGIPSQIVEYVENRIAGISSDVTAIQAFLDGFTDTTLLQYLNENYGEYIEDVEERIEVKTDASKKIISYRSKDGMLHENAGIETPTVKTSKIKGDVEFENGIPTQIKDYVDYEVTEATDAKFQYFDFRINHAFRDISSYYSQFNVSGSANTRTTPWQSWELFDALALAHPDIITKYDPMATETVPATESSPAILPMSNVRAKVVAAGYSDYPFYYNKIEEAETRTFTYPNGDTVTKEYQPCPAYKNYIYRINYYNSALHRGNTLVPKIPVFLTGNLHGIECISPFYLYMLADSIINCADENLFAFGTIFDIYIMPSINAYGAKNGLRESANGVNLNRNFVYNWQYQGEGTNDYSGPYAGSEFETQLLMAVVDTLAPEIAIDHHNYGHSRYQYVAAVPDEKFCAPIYQALLDCCYTFIKELPEYFGNNIQVFQSHVVSAAPSSLSSYHGDYNSWAYHAAGIKTTAIFEVSHGINFINGEYNESAVGYYSLNVFKIADYTYRAGLYAILKYYLSNKLNF